MKEVWTIWMLATGPGIHVEQPVPGMPLFENETACRVQIGRMIADSEIRDGYAVACHRGQPLPVGSSFRFSIELPDE